MKNITAVKMPHVAILTLLLVAIFCGLGSKAIAAEMDIVSYTAYTSLYWLKEAGVPEADEFAKVMGGKTLLDKAAVKNYKTIEPVNIIYHEARYQALNEYIKANNYKNVLDIACGFSPRALTMARQNIRYMGAELNAVAVAASGYYAKCLTGNQKKLATCEAVDATNLQDMLDATDKLDGKICITMDGLMMYLTREEQVKTLSNIRQVLKKHGGAYITLDFCARDAVKAAAQTVYGNKDEQEIYRESAKVYESIAETNFDTAFFKDTAAAKSFIEAQGLDVKRIPLFSAPTTLYCEKKLSAEDKEKLQNFKQRPYLWVITAK